MAKISEAESIFRRQSPKTASEANLDKYLANYLQVYAELWQEKTKKHWEQGRFRVYCIKIRVLDGFFQSMKGKETPLILFGAAKFSTNSNNKLSATLSKKCAQVFQRE